MAKDKDRSINPAAAQRKAEKQKALKKGKAAVTAQRNERLAHRNPERLQSQIDELKARQSDNAQSSPRDQTLLAGLERDVNRIRKARQTLGMPGRPDDGQRRRQGESQTQILGKRPRPPGRQRRQGSPSSSDTDVSARDIPMPRDTPPPIPRRRMHAQHHGNSQKPVPVSNRPSPTASAPEPRLTYESKPVVRDLKKEATTFVPSVVKKKLDAVKGGVQQPLLEEDELDRLEQEGYGLSSSMQRAKASSNNSADASSRSIQAHVWVEDASEDEGG